ncbi:SRPBCC family protein [Nocardioides sp. KIGAM211]|uniref:SRPBCC family protein n=1 Tax=Nocardioides luti TaxID=2761101 RepID=A0A7X0VBH3_9ACTN|nr:SRPBCC family protein [Nocardioides luti]MBB6628410.1 SRPBCC family protein [Nocardioides luti]
MTDHTSRLRLGDDRGTSVEIDGRSAVRFVRTYPHPVERVWRAVTDPAEMPHWFPSQVHYEPRVGSSMRFTGDPFAEDVTGTLLTWEPPRHCAFTWGGNELRFTLEEVEGGCRFELLDLLSAADTQAMNAAGWHVCLARVPAVLGAAAPAPEDTDWQPLYDAYVDAGLGHGAALPH